MPKRPIVAIGKSVRFISRLRGGGSALPGLVVEKLDKAFLGRSLSGLPGGVVVISGTNGKTTTTKMVVEMLRGQGSKVFTNQTGSNFSRGVISSLLESMDTSGKLEADIAVLELDEAHAVHFVREVPPRYCLLLNVMRDQLDRFGEIDATARLLQSIAQATTETVVANREDSRIVSLTKHIDKHKLRFFGLSQTILSHFPSDDELYGSSPKKLAKKPEADVLLEAFDRQTATFFYDKKLTTVDLQVNGIYNMLNAAAALSLVRAICKDTLQPDKLIDSLSRITPAFGRGEQFSVNGQRLELILVKNPSGFRLGLQSFDPTSTATMIAINDEYADGRDMSWLWDVDFASLKNTGVAMVSGIRGYDMALRLQYDNVTVKNVEPSIAKALQRFIADNPSHPKRIFCTYSAMLNLRRELARYVKVERAL